MSLTTTTKPTTNKTLVDIGINLTHRQFQRDREQVIQRALDAGVGRLVLTGTSVPSSREAQQYCEAFHSDHPNGCMQLFSTAGVHPHDSKRCNEENTIRELTRLAQSPRVVAIGECGLDYDRNFSPPDVQREWFEKQLDLAVSLQMPVFLHEREAHEDFFRILASRIEQLPAAVVHCFTGSREALLAYLRLPNCYIGITGWVCDERRGLGLRDIVSLIPDDRLLIETDAPFLFPRDLPKQRLSNKKNRRNEPAFLDHICASIAACRGQTSEHVAGISTANAIRFFQLPIDASIGGLDSESNKATK